MIRLPTRDSLLRNDKTFGFMKKGFNIAMSKPTVLFIFYTDTDAVFVFSASDTFPTVLRAKG